jgi:hypothetical protein
MTRHIHTYIYKHTHIDIDIHLGEVGEGVEERGQREPVVAEHLLECFVLVIYVSIY